MTCQFPIRFPAACLSIPGSLQPGTLLVPTRATAPLAISDLSTKIRLQWMDDYEKTSSSMDERINIAILQACDYPIITCCFILLDHKCFFVGICSQFPCHKDDALLIFCLFFRLILNNNYANNLSTSFYSLKFVQDVDFLFLFCVEIEKC